MVRQKSNALLPIFHSISILSLPQVYFESRSYKEMKVEGNGVGIRVGKVDGCGEGCGVGCMVGWVVG